ncbi:MAG: hypothetical protein WCF26_00955 [Candidatus Sulfotelmatobacter sp.]
MVTLARYFEKLHRRIALAQGSVGGRDQWIRLDFRPEPDIVTCLEKISWRGIPDAPPGPVN